MARRFLKILEDEGGVAAVEYALIVALIVLAMIAGLSQVATATTGMWNNVSSASNAAGSR